MNIEHVPTPDRCQRLEELLKAIGVEVTTEYYWGSESDGANYLVNKRDVQVGDVEAPLASELIAWMKDEIIIIAWMDNGDIEITAVDQSMVADTAANALADMVIHLLKTGQLKKEDFCNG